MTILALMTAGLFSTAAHADKHSGLDVCVASAMEMHPGEIVSLRAEMEDKNHQFELDIKGDDGKNWEVECDSKTGKVLETEREVAADDKEFTSQAKVRLDAALKTALDAYPGAVMKIEYEIEDSGPSYEFDIKTDDGKLLEVEVDAVSGELKPVETVLYQIGGE
ncbi:peptidase M4 [Methylophaga sp. SB9B]|nr:peptidase M4 [Methylophaga sp. SB9B]